MNEASLRSLATGSGAEKWLSCPGSVSLEFGIVEEKKTYASEGTEAHKKASDYILNNTPLEDIQDEAIHGYVDYVRTVGSPGPFFCEHRLPFLGSSGGIDCYCIHGKTGHIFDFKYGIGVKLRAEENEQLAFYACAVKEKHPQLTTITVHLIQPRVDSLFDGIPSISSWTLPHQTLGAWKRRFSDGLDEVERSTALAAGSWCRFCKAKAKCPIQLAYAHTVEAEQHLTPLSNLTEVVPHASALAISDIPKIARLLQAQSRINAWFKKAEELLLYYANQGHNVPGFQLAKKRTNRKWLEILDPTDIAEELKKRGIDDPWEKSLMPLTRAEKIVEIDDLIEKPEGGYRLKPVTE